MQSGARDTLFDERIGPAFLHEDPWNLLRLYHVYRLTLAGALLVALALEPDGTQLGRYDPSLFAWLTGTYLFIAAMSNLASYFQWPDLSVQTLLFVIIDISVLLGLLYASGGVGAGIGILLLVPILIPHLGNPGYVPLGLAAATSIALLALQAWLQARNQGTNNDMVNAGLLALFIMLLSWVSHRWLRKASAVASLAKRRGIDLANLSQLNQSILDKLESGIVVVEGNGVIRHMNDAAWDMLGQPGNWRSKPLQHFAPELNQHLQHWLLHISPRIDTFDVRHQHTSEIRAKFSPLGSHVRRVTLIYLEDTSEQREKLQHAKLASLGQLTASIAHEIRNPLGAISHAAQLLGESRNLDKADSRLLQIIQANARRMNSIIESVLNVSRKKAPNRERLALKLWLNEFRKEFILQHKLDESQISIFIEPADTAIEFDPAHLHQIIWNLCSNALKYAHDDPRKLQLDIHGGNPTHTRDVLLNIADNGRGIPEEQRQRLFEPFFTTSTQGTGLGLFMARELCLTNGANLEYVAIPGGGSCFRIVFAHTQR